MKISLQQTIHANNYIIFIIFMQNFIYYKLCANNCMIFTFGMSAEKRDQTENFFKKKFISKIDVDLII